MKKVKKTKVNKTKVSKTKRRKRWLSVLGVLILCITGFFEYRFYKDHQSYRFDTPEEADFYVVAENGISSFSYQDGLLQETSNNSFKLIEHGLNHYTNRPITQNRYLLFSDYYAPSWKTGRLICVDFEEGKVKTEKSHAAAVQTTGQSSEYFFMSDYKYYDTYLAVYSPNLDMIDKYILNRPLYANSFSVDGNQIYMYGLSMADNENIASYLYHFDLVDGQLNLVQETRLDTADITTYYGNSALVGNKLITTIRGGRNVVTGQENVVSPVIVIDDLSTGERQTVMSERYDYNHVIDLGNGLVAFDYSDTSLMSFTLLNVHDLSNHYISIDPQPDHTEQLESLRSIRRLDADRILVLTNKAIWIYNIPAQQFESQHQLPTHIEGAFDIWSSAQSL